MPGIDSHSLRNRDTTAYQKMAILLAPDLPTPIYGRCTAGFIAVCRGLSPATVSRQHGSSATGVIWYTPGPTGLIRWTGKRRESCWRRCEHRTVNAFHLIGLWALGATPDGRQASAASPDAAGEAVLATCSQCAGHTPPAGRPAPAPRRAPEAHQHPGVAGGRRCPPAKG
jgi:hypothetical protein